MKRIKLDKETHSMYSLRRRGTLGNGIELSPVPQEILSLKRSQELSIESKKNSTGALQRWAERLRKESTRNGSHPKENHTKVSGNCAN